MNAGTIAALSTAAVSVIGAVVALINALKAKGNAAQTATTLAAHIASATPNKMDGTPKP